MPENSYIFLYFKLEQPIYPIEFSKKVAGMPACLVNARCAFTFVLDASLSLIDAPHDSCANREIEQDHSIDSLSCFINTSLRIAFCLMSSSK